MTIPELIQHRLYNQQISQHKFQKPADLVKRMGAIQAQGYSELFWGVMMEDCRGRPLLYLGKLIVLVIVLIVVLKLFNFGD